MKKFLFYSSTLLLFFSSTLLARAAPTPAPTSPYSCKATCMTESSCYRRASGRSNGTCPRAEVCCAELTKPPPAGTTAVPSPRISPFMAPGTDNWTICQFNQWGKEYHPLRPYAASPCASHLIPLKHNEAPFNKHYPYLYQTFSCGKSANPEGDVLGHDVVKITNPSERFPELNKGLLCFDWKGNLDSPNLPAECKYYKEAETLAEHKSYPVFCKDFSSSSPNVCFLAKIIFRVTLDYRDAIFPILGNTKDRTLTDRTKLNNYLSWYLNGSVLQAEGKNLNVAKETDEDRLINFSGPVLKLLSQENMEIYRKKLLQISTEFHDVHLYRTLDDGRNNSKLGDLKDPLAEFTTEEDTVSETQPSIILQDQPTQPEIDGKIVGIYLNIDDADSRLYFPHLKNSLTMSQYLMSTYKPITWDVNPNYEDQQKDLRDLVGQRFTMIQGLQQVYFNGALRQVDWGDATEVYYEWFPGHENTLKVGSISRNTEVIPYNPAPLPLFTNYADRFPSIKSQKCDIKPAVAGDGDTLIGGQIHTTLTIWQAFKYKPSGIVMAPTSYSPYTCAILNLGANSDPQCKDYGSIGPNGCSDLAGDVCTEGAAGTDGSCCYDACPVVSPCEQAGYDCHHSTTQCNVPMGLSCEPVGGNCCSDIGVTPMPRPPRCPRWPMVPLHTKGRIAIFVKVPFVEKLYQLLVEQPDSLIRRFLPYNAGIPAPTGPVNPPPAKCMRINTAACVNASCANFSSASTCLDSPTSGGCCEWKSPDVDYLKTGNKAIVGEGSAAYSAVADPTKGADVRDATLTAGGGGAPALYYPKIGSLFEYLLGAGKDPLNLQCILRPQGYCTATAVNCGEMPELPKASGSCNLGSISSNVGDIPQSLKDLVSAAAAAFNTPPNLILGIMYGEGLFNPGRLSWTDENVANWATCQKIPDCNENGDDHFVGFNGDDFQVISGRSDFLSEIAKIDPARKEFSQCNLLDTIFALSENLHYTASGGGLDFSCFGIDMHSGKVPTSCDWSKEQYAAAIKVAENGYEVSCLTAENSCLLGGGLNAVCNYGRDGCETINNRYTDRSHFGCVWDVAHGD